MHIESVALTNYKSFLERQILNLEPGFNLLVGTNNAGKTSVLNVLDMDINLNEPHRSERTIPQFGGQPNQQSEFEMTLATCVSELWRLTGSSQMYLPILSMGSDANGLEAVDSIRASIEANEQLHLNTIFSRGLETLKITGDGLISGSASRQDGNTVPTAMIQYVPTQPQLQIQIGSVSVHGSIATYGQLFKSRIYRFSAQRRPGVQSGAQGNATLDREAIALPYCINHLQTNDAHGHQILCSWVNRVFPSVKWVQAPPNNGQFEIRCLPHLPEVRRDDLAIPLARMGAGIGNVIAMFYVVLTSRDPQVIAIDEPNAFLHPRALRELLAILESEGKQHQFILTAHSADVLTAVNTRSISLLDFDGVATTVQQVGTKDLHFLRSGLAELGIRMTDLHAKDRVFWVEGQTEELVMPELLRWACHEVAAGTSVLRVERTGTFSKRSMDPAEVAQIYERLSSSSALVPPMVCILLDGERRGKESRDEIENNSKGKLRFLERRMLENYLLHPDAITATILELGTTVNRHIVNDLLAEGLGKTALPEIDGAAVLNSVFSKLSEATLEFRKTRDVQILIDWILKKDPEFLAPLRDCLRKSFAI